MAETIKSNRPDTSDMYEFVWISESGLPIECFFDYNPPDPDDEIIPSAPARDPGMQLRHAFVCKHHDIAHWLTCTVIQEMENMALLDYLRKDREARNKKFGPFFGFLPEPQRSNACFLG